METAQSWRGERERLVDNKEANKLDKEQGSKVGQKIAGVQQRQAFLYLIQPPEARLTSGHFKPELNLNYAQNCPGSPTKQSHGRQGRVGPSKSGHFATVAALVTT